MYKTQHFLQDFFQDKIEKDLQHLGVDNWHEVAASRDSWRMLVMEAKTSDGL